MDLHIYDMKLEPTDVVIMTGRVEKDEIMSFSGYLKVIQNIFPNPVIYIPDDSTFDAMSETDVRNLLKDSMSIKDLVRLCNIANDALREKHEEEEEQADEV